MRTLEISRLQWTGQPGVRTTHGRDTGGGGLLPGHHHQAPQGQGGAAGRLGTQTLVGGVGTFSYF